MRKIPSPGTHNLHFSDKSPFRFVNRFSPLTRANRVRQERTKIKLILAPPPSIPEILSAELGCLHGESRIRDFQRRKGNSSAVPGMENWKKFLRAKRPTALKNLHDQWMVSVLLGWDEL